MSLRITGNNSNTYLGLSENKRVNYLFINGIICILVKTYINNTYVFRLNENKLTFLDGYNGESRVAYTMLKEI